MHTVIGNRSNRRYRLVVGGAFMPDLPSKFSFDAVYYHVKDMEKSIGFSETSLASLDSLATMSPALR